VLKGVLGHWMPFTRVINAHASVTTHLIFHVGTAVDLFLNVILVETSQMGAAYERTECIQEP
jgi:hypothetical protein